MNTTTSLKSDTEPATEAPSAFTGFVLSHLRCARIRTGLVLNRIDTVDVALKSDLIDGESALAMLDEAGLLPLIETSS
jgi:hypothetical protein